MKAEEYLSLNRNAIKEECQKIIRSGAKALITIKDNDGNKCIHRVSTVEEFTTRLPEDKFFKQMREGVSNAVKHRVVPIVIFESEKVRLISLADDFSQEL